MSTKERKLREREDRVQQILAAAERVMGQHGLQGLSMDLVAQEAELAKGTLYIYFDSKDALLAELSLKARKMLLVAFEQAVADNKGAIEQLKAIFKANYTFCLKYPLYYELLSFFEANINLPETAEMQQASSEITILVSGIVSQAQIEGTINPRIDPLQFSICMWGASVGIMQFIKVRGAMVEAQMDITPTMILDTFNLIMEKGIKK